MAKIINIHTGDKTDRDDIPVFECSICNCKFSEQEGGLHRGSIGMIPVSFCPTCFSGIFDMVDYFKGSDEEEEE